MPNGEGAYVHSIQSFINVRIFFSAARSPSIYSLMGKIYLPDIAQCG
jgi:hypothetical protein